MYKRNQKRHTAPPSVYAFSTKPRFEVMSSFPALMPHAWQHQFPTGWKRAHVWTWQYSQPQRQGSAQLAHALHSSTNVRAGQLSHPLQVFCDLLIPTPASGCAQLALCTTRAGGGWGRIRKNKMARQEQRGVDPKREVLVLKTPVASQASVRGVNRDAQSVIGSELAVKGRKNSLRPTPFGIKGPKSLPPPWHHLQSNLYLANQPAGLLPYSSHSMYMYTTRLQE